ncbi:hypothetical protein BLNAU_21127 [Blattamonas nauphoetae]|uniref:Uncharacterized protein n=1 Tax=Blattamonas nauphoetae TaxID=2049346 RepID=A0ABQ9WWV1_9EUKA|nr:hypothetical protein BLNAU_21127 [Blattamonas nauphoetae]
MWRRHADSTLSVPATHAVGSASLLFLIFSVVWGCGGSAEWGVVEKVCSWVEDSKEIGKVLGLLRVVDKLCIGLKGALRSAQKQETEQKEKEKQKVKSRKEQGHVRQVDEESQGGWSLVSRCQSALDLMENTLLGLCSARESEEKESSAEVEVMTQVGGMLIRHFRHVVSGGRKEVGVIGVDVGREMRAMEEREKRREEEMRKRLEEMDKLKADIEKKEEERVRKFELKMAELNEQAEHHKQFIEEERRKEEMKRQSKMGAAAIEWFPIDGYSLNGAVFTRSGGHYPTLLSAKFGNVVVRFTFTFQTITGCTGIGIVASAQTATAKDGYDFTSLVGGAGWDMRSDCQYARQHGKSVHYGSACAAGRGG